MGWIGQVFTFMSSTEVAGLSLTIWVLIFMVISAIGLIIRGNK